MNPNELTAAISAITIMISNSIPDNDELAMFAISIDQLSDNLSAILAQRLLIAKQK